MPTPTIRIRNFMRMNPSKFDDSKVDEDPFEFIVETYKIMANMRVPPNEKGELMAYQLKLLRMWYDQWVVERGKVIGPIAWEEFKGAFLDQFFPLELRGSRSKSSSIFAKEA